jgi:D-lactate dehydrogenase
MPKLKLILTRSTGYNHIDIEYAKQNKIIICNVPYYGENTVAEHTFALLLSISRSLNNTQANKYEKIVGFDLKGKTIGIIGTGSIGIHVIKIAQAFGMNVIAHDKYPNHSYSELLNFEYKSISEIYKQSDIISLHIPLTKET